ITAPQGTYENTAQSTEPANLLAPTPVQDTWINPENANPSRVLTVSNAVIPVQETLVFPEQSTNPSALMTVPDTEQTTTGTIMKLTSPAKVVNVPVAGQPGRLRVG